MTRRVRSWRWLGAVAVVVTCAAGCASGPLVVTDTTHGAGEIKFGYTHSVSGRQGIIECQLAEGGELSNCRDMSIVFDK